MLALQLELLNFQLFPVLWTQSQTWFKEVQPRRVVNTEKMLPPWSYISKSRYSEIYSTAMCHHGVGSLCRSGCCYVGFFVFFLLTMWHDVALFSTSCVRCDFILCHLWQLLLWFKQYSTLIVCGQAGLVSMSSLWFYILASSYLLKSNSMFSKEEL